MFTKESMDLKRIAAITEAGAVSGSESPVTRLMKEALTGYADEFEDYRLAVDFPPELIEKLPEEKREAAVDCLADDPRPSYQNDPERVYSMKFAGVDISFKVDGGRLTVVAVE